MRRVVIESPYTGDTDFCVRYAQACVKDCLRRGEAPFAGRLLYSHRHVLNDEDPTEHAVGIEAGFAWSDVADLIVFYIDFGTSRDMSAAYERAVSEGRPVETRTLPPDLGAEVQAWTSSRVAWASRKKERIEVVNTDVETKDEPLAY